MSVETYDYVIVGAGSAGCVLAARLSEDPDVSVLLVEAGPPDTKENIHVPAAFGSLLKTDVDWDYATAPEDGCNGRMMYLPRGKTLGGSSSINAMVYIRGARADYDGWRDAGNAGWGYDDLLPYFKRSEDNERGESEYHGVGGPLSVSREPLEQPDGATRGSRPRCEAGLERNEDFNGAAPGRRRPLPGDPARRHALLDRRRLPPPGRSTGRTSPSRRGMQVHRVLFDGTRAVGVPASVTASRSSSRAEREVILCAGAYNSPQLLMLSGIGPAEQLALREIDVVVDLPGVGQNLQDHVADRRDLHDRGAGVADHRRRARAAAGVRRARAAGR